jgi:hypothetical protein
MTEVAVLTPTQRRLIADITAGGLYADQAGLLTAALLLAKRHTDRALRFKAEADAGLADVHADNVSVLPAAAGSTALPWAVTATAFADMDTIARDDPIGPPDRPFAPFLDALRQLVNWPANLFRRAYLPPASRVLFVPPYLTLVRFTPERHELLRVLHARIDVADVHEPDDPADDLPGAFA